ncbi:MAG: FtsW/RodA/SpoVE family cell cycle protein [Odoribacteraceae bacterium]|jgi:cell division protein FtsW|nr:FtsW/RodA/SpoVE family cell cycle protein [Odoribacteraceae bacterium]
MENALQFMKKYLVLKGDRLLWAMVILLMFFSLVVVFTSTGVLAYKFHAGNTTYLLMKHFGMLVASVIAILILQSMHYKYFMSFAAWVWFLALICLAIMPFVGVKINDAIRWIRIPVIGLTFQPSEIAKIGVVMWVARIIAIEQDDGHCGGRALFKSALCLLPMIVLIIQENFSTVSLMGLVVLMMLFIGRLRAKLMTITFVTVAVCAISSLWAVYNVPQLEESQRVRIVKERLSGTNKFQLEQSKIAIALGGLHGVGPGKSVQRDFLPNPFSDCVYSITIEEYGLFVGGLLVLLVYLIILYRVGTIIQRCTRVFPALLVAGLGLTIVFQALVHILVCVGLFPVTGQQLPFVSMGGTSTILTGCTVGMIQSVAHTFSEAGKDEERQRQQRRRDALEQKRRNLEREAAEADYVEEM